MHDTNMLFCLKGFVEFSICGGGCLFDCLKLHFFPCSDQMSKTTHKHSYTHMHAHTRTHTYTHTYLLAGLAMCSHIVRVIVDGLGGEGSGTLWW